MAFFLFDCFTPSQLPFSTVRGPRAFRRGRQSSAFWRFADEPEKTVLTIVTGSSTAEFIVRLLVVVGARRCDSTIVSPCVALSDNTAVVHGMETPLVALCGAPDVPNSGCLAPNHSIKLSSMAAVVGVPISLPRTVEPSLRTRVLKRLCKIKRAIVMKPRLSQFRSVAGFRNKKGT